MRTRAVLTYLGIVCIILIAVSRDRAYDDPFITYRYAQNVRAGLGFVYNPGQRVLSTTTPLYTLVLASLGLVWSDLPTLSNVIGIVSLMVCGLFVYRLGQASGNARAGAIGALLFPFSPLMVSTIGAETCFYTMLVLGALCLQSEEKYGGAMLMAALATLTRSDGVLVAGVLFLDYVLRYRRLPWSAALVYCLVIAPWYLFSWAYFGSPFPVTLLAKQQQGQMAISQSFAAGFRDLLVSRLRSCWSLPGTLLLLLGWYTISAKASRWLLILAWGCTYFVAYVLLGVSRYFWYYAPLVPVGVVGVGMGVSWLWTWCGRRSSAVAQSLLRTALVAAAMLPQVRATALASSYRDPRASIYRDVGTWLAENTPPDALVGTLEVGIIGYYAGRQMVDFAGLIQPAVAEQMTRDTTYDDTAQWAVGTYSPDYVVMNPSWFPELMESFVNVRCATEMTFVDDSYDGEIVVYACSYDG